ncbi:MAG: dinitrogenase iron-molybdenum cofactor biosynthesis protein [Deltaproteobacteria bacterium]|nr:dinitrogenase iron-molybdenum cofactor biosynthesis protein [Deltaproteobacteria bacterium]
MKLALAEWQGRVSPVFDVSRHILVVVVREGVVVGRREEYLEDAPILKAKRLASMEIDHLICGAISRPLAGLIGSYGIKMIPFVAGEVEEVIEAFLSGMLPAPDMAMPGCCGRNISFCSGQGVKSKNIQSNHKVKQGRRHHNRTKRGNA